MDAAAIARKYGSTVLGTIGVALWLVALYLLGSAAQNSALFDKWLPWILLINITGMLTLFVLLASKLTRLVRDYRRHLPGSRLKGRTVAIFSALAVAPILIVYYFSLQFINRGIDSWFEIEVSQGLKDTRELSHAALEVRVREFLQHTQVVAHELSPLSDFELIGTLDRERRESTALEFTVVGAQTRILATSSDRPMDTLPVPATDEMMLQVRRGRPYVSLDTDFRRRLRDSRGIAVGRERQFQRPCVDRVVSGTATTGAARGHRAALLYPVRRIWCRCVSRSSPRSC